jgi:hypothetical protein
MTKLLKWWKEWKRLWEPVCSHDFDWHHIGRGMRHGVCRLCGFVFKSSG